VVDLEWEPDLQEDLYHSTDFAALKSMYEKGEIWATNSQYLNDISEMQLGPKAIMGVLMKPFLVDQELLSRIKPVVERLQALGESISSDDFQAMNEEGQKALKTEIEAEIPLSFADDWQKAFDPWKDFPRTLVNEIASIAEACRHAMTDTTCFVFSLSKEPDQLSQWRAYAKDGVCIQFSAEALCKSLDSAPASRARMQSVRYYDENATMREYVKLEDYARPIIDWAGERRTQLIADGADEATRKVIIAQELMTRLAFVKDIHFEEEGEVRIAVQGNPNHFTTPHRYGIVPKMKLSITPDAIRSVIVGPSAHKELRIQSLRTHFDNWGFKNDPNSRGQIEVKPSAVPYRDWSGS
jgi:Protein of unknown function (DUF2971)